MRLNMVPLIAGITISNLSIIEFNTWSNISLGSNDVCEAFDEADPPDLVDIPEGKSRPERFSNGSDGSKFVCAIFFIFPQERIIHHGQVDCLIWRGVQVTQGYIYQIPSSRQSGRLENRQMRHCC